MSSKSWSNFLNRQPGKKLEFISFWISTLFSLSIILTILVILISKIPKYSQDLGTIFLWFCLGISVPSAIANFKVGKSLNELLASDEKSSWTLKISSSTQFRDLKSWRDQSSFLLFISLFICAILLLS
jgi:hypothetical protein